ncbi:E3 ubiquitin-protein ligase mbr2 [Thalictrum thalictroides]|uniref:RING-type E3 ubiquitin transferase n=1 Tax=Thalictrum thalictroides TaxID=46969 RepID=A0A7J6WIC9_THATH|nr:E3 ubiquitin-protein ligase mbr2 [Thalictrum thalictroides]
MGGYTPKTAVNRLGFHRESQLSLKETSNNEDRDVRCCNRLGCSIRQNSQGGTLDRAKNSRPSFRSTSAKSLKERSSKTCSKVSNSMKHHDEHKNLSSPKESETSNIPVQTEVSDSILSTVGSRTQLSEADDVKSGVLKVASVNILEEVKGKCVIINTKTLPRFPGQAGLANQNSSYGSPKVSSASRKVTKAANSASRGQVGLKKVGCASVSDVLPAGCAALHLSRSTRSEVVKKRSDGDCSSSNRKIMNGSFSRSSSSTRSSFFSSRLALSEPVLAQQSSRRIKMQTLSRNDVASVRSQAMTSGGNRGRTFRHEKGNRTLLPVPQNELLSTSVSPLPTSLQLCPTTQQNSFSRQCGNNETVHGYLTAHTDDDTGHPLHALPVDQDDFRSLATDGITQVLSVLERIQQDEELTYEQRLLFESHLFLDGYSFLDQHRDMRLDIEDMSYEELLDLEEKMGSVSMGLTEEALSNCLKRSLYKPFYSRSKSCANDDAKCSICQEEYRDGDEVGKLVCDHGYHMVCIHQWLQQKNWCPICKAPATHS